MSVTVTTTQQLKQGMAKLWIVLVGIDRYLDSNIPDLNYCAKDCEELTEALEIATGQFQQTEIISLYDGGNLLPERSPIINSIQKFRLAKPEDTVLFYFSGHGYLDTNNRPVLCVADTRLDNLTETGLKLDLLLNELSQCQAQRQLVWLDACQEREQQSDTQIKQNPTQQLSAALKEQAEKSQNFHAMLSCDKQERSWEIEELQHGLFTFCLIEGLRGKAANSKGQIDADGLFNYVERITSRIIEDKKNPVDETLSKGMVINVEQIKQSSPPPKTKRLPANASQTPQRIVRGGGELVFLIGLAAPINNRKALVIDRLSNSEADIRLCKLLQAQGNFTVEYRYLRDKQQWQLQQDIASYLAANNRTVLLYLSGTIESTANQTYELVGDSQHRINLNWLAKELKASPVKEIVLIANITKAKETTPSLKSILQLNCDLPLCLIEATSQPGDREFLTRLVATLETAAKTEKEFWVTELFSPLQKWSLEQPDIKVIGWWGTVGIIEILSVEVQRSCDRVFDIEVCPYKSLKAFTQDDAYFFHGREELIDKIVKKLESNSFLTVVGASGSGKSSVVRAGVVPKLVTNGLNTSQSQQTQACQTWVMLPGDNPFTALAKAIAPNEPKLIEGVLHAGVKGFVDWLRQQPQAIYVLAIDQFEELFTLTPEKEGTDFIRLIIAAVERAGDCFKVIITLRGDFINECLNLGEIAPLMEQNEILVTVKSSRLEDEQYRQIIAQPAQKVGLEVEEGLMAVLLEELKNGSLPLLQYALEELWQKRSQGKLTLKDYQQYIGRLGQFLSDKAEATYKNLNQLQQECAQSIFLSLVYLAEEQDKTNKDTRRRLLKSDLRVNKYKYTLDDTLQALVEARLIVVSGEENNFSLVTDGDRQNALAVADEVKENNSSPDRDTVEIAHEILINNWKTLEGWLKDNRDKYRLIREINQRAKDWKQNDRQEGFLLSKGALAKYEESYVKYADEFPKLSDRFMDASIQARDKADKLAKRRHRQTVGILTGGITILATALVFALGQLRRATINEVNALHNSAETLLASNQKLDALTIALKAGKLTDKNYLGLDFKIRLKILNLIQNIFYQTKEYNRLESQAEHIIDISLSPNGQIIASIEPGGEIELWNTDGKLLYSLKTSNRPTSNVVFGHNSQTFAYASDDKTIKLWNIENKPFHQQTLKGHTDNINQVIFSPDGKTIASASDDKTIKLWNIQGRLLHTLEDHNEGIGEIKFSPDGKTIISIDSNNIRLRNRLTVDSSISVDKHNTVKLWSIEGQLLHTLKGHTDDINNIEFSPDGQTIASASDDKTVKLWNVEGQLLHTLEGHTDQVNSVAFSPDGQTIASASYDGTVELWNLRGRSIDIIDGYPDDMRSVVFSPDGKTIGYSDTTGNTRLVRIKKNRRENLFSDLDGYIKRTSNIVFTPDSKAIVATDNAIELWNLRDRLLKTITVDSFENDTRERGLVASNTKKDIIASAKNDDAIIRLWNFKGQLLNTFTTKSEDINDIEFSSDGRILASINDNRMIELWNTNGKSIHVFRVGLRGIKSVKFSPDGQLMAFTFQSSRRKTRNSLETSRSDLDSNKIELRNLKGELLHILEGHTDYVDDVIFSPDGQTIASISRDNTVKLWDLNGTLLNTLESHNNDINRVIFSPDGQIIAAFDDADFRLDSSNENEDKVIKLWNIQGDLISTIKNNSRDSIKDMEFIPDKKIIISAGNDSTIKLWSYQGQLLQTLKGHTGFIKDVELIPERKIIVSAGDDSTVKLWSYQGQLLQTLKGHTGEVDNVVVDFASETVASISSRDGTIKLWSLDLDDVMTRGCDWARDYLKNNPNVSEEDKKICDDY
jgi:WD40 repeat protein/energy-coupling factor transporter ATP-binding protein EcfA2